MSIFIKKAIESIKNYCEKTHGEVDMRGAV